MATRYVVLVFEVSDEFPEALHPADNFLGRFEDDGWLNADIGAAAAVEVAEMPSPGRVVLPPRGRLPRGWLDEVERR